MEKQFVISNFPTKQINELGFRVGRRCSFVFFQLFVYSLSGRNLAKKKITVPLNWNASNFFYLNNHFPSTDVLFIFDYMQILLWHSIFTIFFKYLNYTNLVQDYSKLERFASQSVNSSSNRSFVANTKEYSQKLTMASHKKHRENTTAMKIKLYNDFFADKTKITYRSIGIYLSYLHSQKNVNYEQYDIPTSRTIAQYIVTSTKTHDSNQLSFL